MRSLFLFSALLILTIFNSAFSQTPKIVVGDCIDDTPFQVANYFIDTDNSGIYFLKKGKEKSGSNYVEKYDSKTLKKIYKCVLPTIFDDDVIDTKYYNERQNFVILNNGKIDIIFTSLESESMEIYTVHIDENGKCSNQATKIYSLKFNNKPKKKEVIAKISPQKKYFCVYNTGESSKNISITNFKININENLTLDKLFNYDLKITDTETENCLSNVYDDGRIGSYYSVNEKIRLAMLDKGGKLFSKDISDIIKDNSIVHDLNALNNINPNRQLTDITENTFTIFNKKQKKYGFLSLKYDPTKNELINNGLNYIDTENTLRLTGEMNAFDKIFEAFDYRESFIAGDYTYKIISRGYIPCNKLCLDVQSYLILLIYDKQNKLVGQKIVPFQLKYHELSNDMYYYGDLFTETDSKNYATVLKNGELYIFTNENENNRKFDVEKGLIKDFDQCNNIKTSDYNCHSISPTGKISKFLVNSNNPDNYVFNIPNNYRFLGNYQYVYLKIKGKKTLGKIIID